MVCRFCKLPLTRTEDVCEDINICASCEVRLINIDLSVDTLEITAEGNIYLTDNGVRNHFTSLRDVEIWIFTERRKRNNLVT